jgi:uncharacterized iron-regulated membrane protein
MKRTFRRLHLWLAAPFGLIISVVCLTGAALVFEKEINEATHPELYFVKVEGEPLPLDTLTARVAATLPDSVSVTGITVATDAGRAYQVRLSKPRRASLYVNPYTGEVTGRYERAPFFMFMFRLHRWLLDTNRPGEGVFWGRMIVGAATLAYVFVLISGLVVWWPRNRTVLRNRLTIARHKGWRRLWYDCHVSLGFYLFIFLLLMSLTGLTWSFEWYRNAVFKVFGTDAFRTIYALHVGDFGGLPTRILWFVAALVGSTLPLTGYYMWYKRKRGGREGRR